MGCSAVICSSMECLLLQPWDSLFCFSLCVPSSSLCPTFWALSCPGVAKVPSQGHHQPEHQNLVHKLAVAVKCLQDCYKIYRVGSEMPVKTAKSKFSLGYLAITVLYVLVLVLLALCTLSLHLLQMAATTTE